VCKFTSFQCFNDTDTTGTPDCGGGTTACILSSNHVTEQHDHLTKAGCAVVCQNANFSVAGVDAGNHCYCGNPADLKAATSKAVPLSQCNSNTAVGGCSGNHSDTFCGAIGRMLTYSFACHAPAALKTDDPAVGNATNRSVVWGSARFTVLTPKVIRLEYSASYPPQFDDLPSTLVLDRAPGATSPPHFTHSVTHVPNTNSITLTLNTSALSLRFIAGAFTSRSLAITLLDSGKVWRPGADSSGNLNGSLNTMDCYPVSVFHQCAY
jgi:hypothetical protein